MTMNHATNAPFPIQDTVGAWVPHGHFVIPGQPQGPLSGLRFAVKDLFDVAGHPTGAGNPQWLASHPVPSASSPLVDTLLQAGATLCGKLVTDELAYSIHGDNIHYGAPTNSAAPDRVTGGSSSGSAAAVTARLVDFALGTDTGGSTRVPASYCGIWGLRPTHGILSQQGLVPLHPNFDTPTWLAHDAATFERVAEVLLPGSTFAPTRVLQLSDAWTQSDAVFHPLLQTALDHLAAQLQAPVETVVTATEGLEAWRQCYVTASAHEGWQTHGAWISSHTPEFAAPIAARWQFASSIKDEDAAQARAEIVRIRTHVRALLGSHGVAVLPSAASVAPTRDADPQVVDAVRLRTLRITCIAGLAGLPQVSLPLRGPDGLPAGVSLLGPAGSDRMLVRLAVKLWQDMTRN